MPLYHAHTPFELNGEQKERGILSAADVKELTKQENQHLAENVNVYPDDAGARLRQRDDAPNKALSESPSAEDIQGEKDAEAVLSKKRAPYVREPRNGEKGSEAAIDAAKSSQAGSGVENAPAAPPSNPPVVKPAEVKPPEQKQPGA